jgi:hydroxyacylglutathione hydrolase
VVLIAEPGREVEAATRLGRIGFDVVAGYLAGGMQPLDGAPELIERTERITAGSLDEQLASSEPPLVIDVRTAREWSESRIHGAINAPLARFTEHLGELGPDRPLVVYCATGYRSAIAASLLTRAGRARVADLIGGIGAWQAARMTVAGASSD